MCKWFKTGAVYEDTYFEKDLKAVDKAQEIIDTWNALNISNTIHLNRPEVWVFDRDSRCKDANTVAHATLGPASSLVTQQQQVSSQLCAVYIACCT